MNGLYELSIEVTNECTLACIHCSSGSTPKKMPNELTIDEHIRLLREARELGAQVLSLSGGNPLLYDNLLSIIDEAGKLQYQSVLLYTTGHNRHGRKIYDYPMLNCLCVPGLTFIFSLHSHEPEINDKIMNYPGAWRDIVDSISWLTAAGINTEIHMVPMRPNHRHIAGMKDLCKQLGVKKMSLLRFVPQTRGAQNIDALGMSVVDFSRMQYEIDVALHHDHEVQVRAGCPIDFRHSVGLREQKAKPCHAGDDLILVRPDGSVHPCAAWKSLEVDSNVREQSLHHIWHYSKVFNEIRRYKKAGYKQIEGVCSTCPALNSCMGGCPAQRLHAYGKTLEALYVDKSDPLCPRGAK